jgi:Anaphase-promoting complex, cyclosome, subunit 3/Tetratricopeptide repeat
MSDPAMLRAAAQALVRDENGTAWKFANAHLNDEPDSPEALFIAGKALRDLGHVGLALTVLRRALALDNTRPTLWMQFGAALHDLHRWDEAREAFLVVHKHFQDDPMPVANIASGYVQMGRPREALEWAEKALAIDPEVRIGKVAHSFANLALGRWAEGWRHAEWVYGYQVPLRVYCEPEEPQWDGGKGQTVVVQCDQGLGDQIMFAQCLPQLAADCKEVIVECSPRMAGLLRRSFPMVTVKDTLKQAHFDWPRKYAIDARVHISLLGRWYRTRNSDFPRKAYLTPDPERVARWKAWLEQFPRPWTGIAWRGGIAHTMAHLRSMELGELAPVLEQDGTPIDLSYQDTTGEVARWNVDHLGRQIVRPLVDVDDYDDTVALVAAVDDVVTVTTTLAHVCGALGRHAYVLVPQAPQWRYHCAVDDGLWWYAEHSVELCRQAPGELGWQHAVGRVAKARERLQKLRRAA